MRKLADFISEKLGYPCVVPKLQPPLREGTDGDALPPDFKIDENTMQKLIDWIAKNGTDTFTKRNNALIADLKSRGFHTFLAAGTCWGGWASFRCARDFPGLLSAINIWHPSCQLEGVHKGDVIDLAKSVKCPVYFHVCSNDDRSLYESDAGKIVQAVRSNNVRCIVDYYPDMMHGFMTRGSDDDCKVQRDLTRGLETGIAFLSSFGSNSFVSTRSALLLAVVVGLVKSFF